MRIVLRIGAFIIDSAFCPVLFLYYLLSLSGAFVTTSGGLSPTSSSLDSLPVTTSTLALSLDSLGISLHDFRFLNLKLSFSTIYLVPFQLSPLHRIYGYNPSPTVATNTMSGTRLPEKFDDLSDKRRYWPASAGSQDEGLGMLRILTPDIVANAARTQIQTGERVCLNWELEKLNPPGTNI